MDREMQAAMAAADAAGRVIRRYFREPLAAERKADSSPVTEADRAAEQAMRDVLRQHFPDDAILGEEAGRDGPDGARAWVLDPIDGTRAFITGRPTFCALIALVVGGRPVLGLIDQPVTGERWTGSAGQPTRFAGRFGGRAGCRACVSLGQAELSVTSPEVFGPDLPRWQRLAGAAGRVSYGGDGYAYGLLALGQIDVIAEATMQVWDWAALVPVVEGAGGRVTDWAGAPLRRDGPGQVLAVGDPGLLGPAIAALRG